jgi:predicted nuclease with TOPRIM domain
MNQRTLLSVEQDPARKAELEAESKRLGNEIDSEQDQIKSLENDIQLINAKKKKVPNKKDW